MINLEPGVSPIRAVLRKKRVKEPDEKWAVFGRKRQEDWLGRNRAFSNEFKSLLDNKTLDTYFTERKERNKTNHILELFGPKNIEAAELCDSITAVTLTPSEEDIAGGEDIIGSLFESKPWREIKTKSQKINGFDIVFCRALRPFMINILDRKEELLIDGYLGLFRKLLERTFDLVKPDGGEIFIKTPDFIFLLGDTDRNISASNYVSGAINRQLDFYSENGISIDFGQSGVDESQVIKITRNIINPNLNKLRLNNTNYFQATQSTPSPLLKQRL
ncbi:MAG: hypothetical protein V1803_01765 [Candidatus Roizmanbacteria bacterium]